jgi:hypothetical protein
MLGHRGLGQRQLGGGADKAAATGDLREDLETTEAIHGLRQGLPTDGLGFCFGNQELSITVRDQAIRSLYFCRGMISGFDMANKDASSVQAATLPGTLNQLPLCIFLV